MDVHISRIGEMKRKGEIRCDEAMAKHKSIKYLYHLQKGGKTYRQKDMLYGNCNHDCKNCICGMYDVDLVSKIEAEHIPEKKLKNGSAQMSVMMIALKR